MLMVKSVKIIHKREHTKEYRLLADFFRLIGVFVCHCTLKREKFSNDFDVIFLLSKDFDKESIENVKKQYLTETKISKVIELEELGNVTLDTKIEEEKEELKKYLNKCLEKIKDVTTIPDKTVVDNEMKALKGIVDIYIEHRICYFLNMYQCAPNELEIVQEAQNQLVDAYIELTKNVEKTSQVYYTLANLGRCMNQTSVLLEEEFLLETEKILRHIDEALKLEPVFDNAYLLKALVTEMDLGYRVQSKIYYKMALERIGDKSYSSYFHYLEGKYYGNILKDASQAKLCYEKSLEINPFEYQAVFGLAMIHKEGKEYLKAIEELKRVSNILSEAEKEKRLQPKEYEYLLKAYSEQAKIQGYYMFNKEKYELNIEKVHQLSKMKNNSMYEELFEEGGKRNEKL